MTSNMNYIVALGVGFKCPRKIHLNTQCPCVDSYKNPEYAQKRHFLTPLPLRAKRIILQNRFQPILSQAIKI